MRRRIALVLGLLAVAGAVGAWRLAAGTDEQVVAGPPVALAAADFDLRGSGDASPVAPLHGYTAAQAVVPQLAAYAEPEPAVGTAPISQLPNPTVEGFPLVVSVIDRTPDGQWLLARLPQRPNGSTGWIRSTDVQTWQVPNRIEVSVSERRLRVLDENDAVLFDIDVSVGSDATPTPLGDFYIDIVNPLGNHRTYGWGQLSVAGYSEVLERFAGGIGQIAIHGWNDPSAMGRAISNGCVRMRNEDIARVAELAPLGTPVHIAA